MAWVRSLLTGIARKAPPFRAGMDSADTRVSGLLARRLLLFDVLPNNLNRGTTTTSGKIAGRP